MDLDFKVFIKLIKDKTGIDLVVYTDEGDYVIGNAETWSRVDGVDTITSDVVKNKTLFPIMHRNRRFIGCISGAGVAEHNYASLIRELAENLLIKETDLTRTDFYKAVLAGEFNYSQLRNYSSKFSVVEAPSCAMLITLNTDKIDEVISLIKTYGEGKTDIAVKIDESQCVLIKIMNEEEGEYQSCAEYAEFLVQSVYEELGLRAKVCIGGTVKSIYDLSLSYSQALTANRMALSISSKGDVHSFKEYVLVKMLEDLPKYKLNEYMQILTDASAREVFEDEEMNNTAEEFLENSLNISETARKLYLHRNTLMYRLDKIEKQTGLNLRKFSDAVTFRLITILAKLVK